VLQEIRKHWPQEKSIILRISAEDYKDGGNNCEDLGRIVNLAKEYGLDLINVSSGGVVIADVISYPGYQLKFAEKIRDYTKLPVIAGGLITAAEMAEEALQNDRADYIYLGRALLRDPNWPYHSAKALGVEVKITEQYERAYL
jgi:NADPH2 dehydrogenase